jgi:hypothetical protein
VSWAWRLAVVFSFLVGPALAQSMAPASPDAWLARAGVELAVLDKVTARVTPLTARVGQTVRVGTLSVAVRSCLVRGPDQIADQAVFLDISDARDPDRSFHGWMLMSVPGVSMLAHPIYDIRLAGCRA